MRRTPEACPEYQTKADMSHDDWAPEVNHACFIKSSQSVVDLHAPENLWREEAADYLKLQFSCSRLSCNVNSQEIDKLEKRPRAIGLTTEVREGSPVTRSAFTNYVLDNRALLHGSMKTGVEAHCGAHVCSAGSWMEEDKLSVVTDTTRESLVSGGDGDEATTQLRPRPFVLSTKVKYLGREETCSHVGLPKGFKVVSCRGVFHEKDGEQDFA